MVIRRNKIRPITIPVEALVDGILIISKSIVGLEKTCVL